MDDSSRLRRKDTTKGPPLRILSLDGGGVRGYSMLILLQELMHRTYVECEGKAPKRDQIPKPADHFDLIAGTGTGGLIAIMLGRLRLDIETCKQVYVRMTRRVFETDKRIAGIPYTTTLFKASKLEEAIKDCVREHTIFVDEGNDGSPEGGQDYYPMTPNTPGSGIAGYTSMPDRSSSISISSAYSPVSTRGPLSSRWGNANAYLYDNRENRTKTAVTAVYKGTPKNGSSALLRSYDSRKEPAPEFNCTIWQAGRATSAIGLAFKPIQIGQSVFIDEGVGKYNPAPLILDEAAVNEWPGREVGVFVSIGTGKRPSGTNNQQSEWWEGFLGGSLGGFAEAKRRLVMKIEGCEDTHQYMRTEHLAQRGVNPENYYRLNVEVGVGEFGMNEWNRVSEISTNTRQYLAKPEVQKINLDAAAKMARIELARRRHTRYTTAGEPDWYEKKTLPEIPPPLNPMAVELPADVVLPLKPRPRPGPQYPVNPPHPYERQSKEEDKFIVIAPDQYPQTSSGDLPYRLSSEQQYHDDRYSNKSYAPSPRRSHEGYGTGTPPPLPPKNPIRRFSDGTEQMRQSDGRIQLPYQDNDGPPPVVNFARKPEYPMR